MVDEAHHISVEVLEEVRLLTNLETPQEKLLQILLIGQPELDQKLDSRNLRQLKQRIAVRSHLGCLELAETRGYVYRRLQIAGSSNPAQLFPMDTILEVHRQSKGLPRLVNTLCENALIHGYARQLATISPEIIDEIAAEFRLNVEHAPAGQAGQGGPSEEVAQAARTLLDLYSYLRSAQQSRTDLRVVVGAGAHKQ